MYHIMYPIKAVLLLPSYGSSNFPVKIKNTQTYQLIVCFETIDTMAISIDAWLLIKWITWHLCLGNWKWIKIHHTGSDKEWSHHFSPSWHRRLFCRTLLPNSHSQPHCHCKVDSKQISLSSKLIYMHIIVKTKYTQQCIV